MQCNSTKCVQVAYKIYTTWLWHVIEFISLSEQANTWARGYKTFFMLNSVQHEILNAHKYKDIKKLGLFVGSDKPRMLFFPFINLKMPTTVGILTFVSRKNFHAQLS